MKYLPSLLVSIISIRATLTQTQGRRTRDGSGAGETLGYTQAMQTEMTSRLEEARKQGQKVAEIQKSGEIDALHEQLGTKNK